MPTGPRDIIDRIRDHIKKAPPRKDHFDLGVAINEVMYWRETQLSGIVFRSRVDLPTDCFPFKATVFNCNKFS
jgi:hypothetical protein